MKQHRFKIIVTGLSICFTAFSQALLAVKPLHSDLSAKDKTVALDQENSILFMQQPAISPDGKWIAFEYKSNIYKVPSAGGNAIPLTINSAYNGYPVWSNDGKRLAFASNRYGNFDVYIMSAEGGTAQRLTFNSAKDIPFEFSADDKTVYFGTDRHDESASVRFPADNLWTKLFAVPSAGGASLMINGAGTDHVHFDLSGKRMLFQDRKGNEDIYRKHHRSPVTRDIWVYDFLKKTYKKLTDFDGEDTEPVWGKGDEFYYLSERNGTFNVFESSLTHPEQVKEMTQFARNPVRNLSRSATGILAFTQNGEMYTMPDGEQPRKIGIRLNGDFNDDQLKTLNVNGGASEMDVSPNGKEIAYIYHGEVFVTAIDGSGTRRITNTAAQEKMIEFSPDGRSLLFSQETGGSWDICRASIGNNNEPYFYAATSVNIQPVVATTKDEFGGMYSPDGKKIAYVEERNIIKVYDLATHTSKTVLPEGQNYSYTDGDLYFVWSPDSKHLLVSSSEGYRAEDNALIISTEGSFDPIRITRSGFGTSSPQWGMNGRVIYYSSTKNSLKPFSDGAQPIDIYATFLDGTLYDQFNRSKSESALRDEIKKRDSVGAPGIANLSKPEFNLKNAADALFLENHTKRLTSNPVYILDSKLSPDGETLYSLSKYDSRYDLWSTATRTGDTRLLTKLDVSSGGIQLSKDGKVLYVIADGALFKINTNDGSKSSISINTTMTVDESAERQYEFEHTFHTIEKKFFDPKLQGTDWKYYHDQYERFLPHINNNYDFQVALSEFLGELNSSHTGARFAANLPNRDQTAALGLLYNSAHQAAGLFVEEVLKGGPFDNAETHMTKGCTIDKIDDMPLGKTADWATLLNRKSGQYTKISFHDRSGHTYHEIIKPITQAVETNDLLYNRWVRQMEHLTDSLSGGKIGYIHIRLMDEASLRKTMDELDGKFRGKTAVILDTRYNGGGNIHEQVTALFSEKVRITYHPQGQTLELDRLNDGSRKPTCMIVSEGNYSDAFNTPYEYQRVHLGKVVGTPVAGTGTGVYWEKQVDNSLIIGIPMLALTWVGETSIFENHQLDPDVLVYDHYNKLVSGQDEQLEAAVKELQKTTVSK